MRNRIEALVRFIAFMVCIDVALIIRSENFLLLAGVNGLLAAAWLLMPESNEPNDED